MNLEKTLADFKNGEKIKVLSVNCGRNLSRRLCDLGLFEGTEIEIFKNDNFGPLIIKILNSKIALGRGEAEKIYGEKI